MSSIYDRRKGERVSAITTAIRLAVEVAAIIWAVAGLNNATNNLKEAVSSNTKMIQNLSDRMIRVEMKVDK
jgi:hypothetical protein